MISSAGIPTIPGDMDALAGHATSISTAGTQFAATGDRVHSTWQGLAASYRAPEAEQLFAATLPVQMVSSTVGADLGAAGTALSTYAAEVKAIQAALEALRAKAVEFEAFAAANEDWRDDQANVDRDQALVDGVADQMAAFLDAQRRCANALRALYGAPPLQVDNGDGVIVAGSEFGYTAEQLRAAGHQEGAVPWGFADERDLAWYEEVGHFFVGIGDAGVDLVVGLGSLVGYGDGGWSWDTAGTAWAGVGKLVTAVAVYGSGPLGAMADQQGWIPGLQRGELGQTLENTGKAIIAYDQWSEDPSRAAGHTLGNIVAAVVGTKGAGAALKVTGAAVTGARTAGAFARVGGGISAAGRALSAIPTVDQLALGAARRLPGFRVPSLAGRVDVELGGGSHFTDAPAPVRVPEAHPAVAPAGGSLADAVGPTPHLDEGPPGSPTTPDNPATEGRPPLPGDHDGSPAPAAVADPPPRSSADHRVPAGDRVLETVGARSEAGGSHATGAGSGPRSTPLHDGRAATSGPPDGSHRPPPVPGAASHGDDGSTTPAHTDGSDASADPGRADDGLRAGPTNGAEPAHHTPVHDQPDAARADGADALTTDPASAPSPGPGERSLGTVWEGSVTRSSDGLIDTVDGRSVDSYLREVGEQRAAEFRAGREAGDFTRGAVGDVMSVVLDRRTGEIIEGTNGRLAEVIDADRVHPLLAQRLADMDAGPGYPSTNSDGTIDPGLRRYPHPDRPLRHAEVKALNELLWRRGTNVDGSVFKEFQVDNFGPFGKDGVKARPYCANCSILLRDTHSNAGRFTGFPPSQENYIPG